SEDPEAGAPAPRSTTPADPGALRVETLVSGLDTPWDLAWGPDGAIWVTERPGRVSRVDPATGEIVGVGELDVVEVSESGLMGMAFHPDFDAEPRVYLAHSDGGRFRMRNRLVRMRFDGSRLGEPEVLLDGIPGARNHDGSRLAVGPDGFLYMTTGDAGRASRAQDRGSLAGKVLRLTLEGEPAPGNPFGSRVYSYGHRNAQGLDFHPATGALYSAEHGPGTDDEVNRILPGANYGWPDARGFCDGRPSGEAAFCRENEVVEPLSAWTPTVAVSGLAVYEADRIPGWKGSLLVTSLAGETLYRLALSPDGDAVTEREALFAGRFGRLRAVLVGPDGAVYLATSNRDGRGNPAPDDDRILRILP
ncbi:MAG: PQQ-dependent sugar dehydrogenase, partial [Gemmatimonadota bacterium]